MKKGSCLFVSAVLIALVGLAGVAFANDVAVQNVSLANIGGSTADVSFQLKQDNAWGTSASPLSNGAYDVIWVFVKYSTEGGADGSWHHAKVTGTGATSDGRGAFLDVANATTGSWESKTLTWQFGDQGVSTSASARVKVCAIEMVVIPQGDFYFAIDQTEADRDPDVYDGAYAIQNAGSYDAGWLIDGVDHIPNGASSGWPNGYSAFYVAKYEVSQGQWVDFLNTLSDAEAAWYYAPYNKDETGAVTQGSYGNNVLASEAADTTFSTTTPTRGMNYPNWNDCRAYAS